MPYTHRAKRLEVFAGGSVGWKGNSPSISRSLPSSGRETHPKNKGTSCFGGRKKKILFEWNKGRITWVIFDVARFQLPFEVESIFKKLRDETFPLTIVEFENVDVKGNLKSLNLDILCCTVLTAEFLEEFWDIICVNFPLPSNGAKLRFRGISYWKCEKSWWCPLLGRVSCSSSVFNVCGISMIFCSGHSNWCSYYRVNMFCFRSHLTKKERPPPPPEIEQRDPK